MMKLHLPLALLGILVGLSGGSLAAEKGSGLPWEKDYAAAFKKAVDEKRPLFLMLTAEWCGPCKILEKNTLTDPSIREGLKEFVWVQAFEDDELNKKFSLNGYPTLVFLNPATDQVIVKTTGSEPANSFMKHVYKARKGAGLPLTDEMKAAEATRFEPDYRKMAALLEAGDVSALTNYLEPAKRDRMRTGNYFLMKVNVPRGVKFNDVVMMGGDHDEWQLSDGGLALRLMSDGQENGKLAFQISAPGCCGVLEEVTLKKDEVIATHEVTLARLDQTNSASFAGRVVKADGAPVPDAIVRICDWDVARADERGIFQISGVSPGKFTVRAEAPGGEFHEELQFSAGKALMRDLTLKPVTTVGIRWALQTKEGVRRLDDDNVKKGEAYFSIPHSRFVLGRGAESRQYWGSDFMLDKWKPEAYRAHTEARYAREADSAPPGAPIFWLFDATGRQTGLHLEEKPFDDIIEVKESNGAGRYFEFLRGKPAKKGDVYTVWCVQKDCFAKMEITDVTIVSEK